MTCGKVIHDQFFNSYFHQKLESVQCNGALALTGAIRETSREKFYQELGLESLQQRWWYRKLCCFVKFLKAKHLDKNTNNSACGTRNADAVRHFNICHQLFKFLFSLHRYWMEHARSKHPESFKSRYIQKEINHLYTTCIFICENPRGIKFLTKLRLGHLHQRNLNMAFKIPKSPICRCWNNIETTIHHLHHCSNYSNKQLGQGIQEWIK